LKKAKRKEKCEKVDELLKVILSGEIFSEFETETQVEALKNVPE